MKSYKKHMFENKILSQKEISEIFLPIIKKEGTTYKKTGKVEAVKSDGGEKIETITSDGKETKNTTKKGDWIITNLDGNKERYVIKDSVFKSRYKKSEKENIYIPTGECEAIKLNSEYLKKLDLPKEFKFIAEWGEEMVFKKDDFLATTDRKHVYRIAKKEFLNTYKRK